MTWQTSYSGTSALNLGPSHGGNLAMFHLKELMKDAGWSVLMSGDGIGYNPTGDQITHASSGVGGMANNYAWFRIRDPGDRREYVIQRGTSSYSWKMIYSALDRFTGGSPDATTIPTAADQYGLADNSVNFANIFPNSDCMACVAVQDVAHNGVYAFWVTVASMYVNPPDLGTILCEAMDSSFSTADTDPCAHYVHDVAPDRGFTASSNPNTTSSWCGWMKHDMAGEEFNELTTLYYQMVSYIWAPDACIVNPHTGKHVLLPIHYIRFTSTGTTPGYKGVGKYYTWKPGSAFIFPAVIVDAVDTKMVWGDIILPGLPTGFSPQF